MRFLDERTMEKSVMRDARFDLGIAESSLDAGIPGGPGGTSQSGPRIQFRVRLAWLLTAQLMLAAALFAPQAWAQAPAQSPAQGELFPQPFVVEHQVIHLEGDGTRYISDPVKDTYGGSWLVSERHDGSRLVLDLARREILEIRPEQGNYWRIGFTRLADLQARMERLDEMPTPDGLPEPVEESAEKSIAGASVVEPQLSLQEETLPLTKSFEAGAPRTLESKSGVRHFRVELMDAQKSAQPTPVAEVSVDPSIRLSARAQEALGSFERDALRADRRLAGQPSALAVMKAVRQHTDGAFPVRLSRKIPGGTVEDVVTRLESIERFDLDLVRVPDGLERVPHPLESALVFMEKEAERRQLMGSLPQ